jgi:hypothetical protein
VGLGCVLKIDDVRWAGSVSAEQDKNRSYLDEFQTPHAEPHKPAQHHADPVLALYILWPQPHHECLIIGDAVQRYLVEACSRIKASIENCDVSWVSVRTWIPIDHPFRRHDLCDASTDSVVELRELLMESGHGGGCQSSVAKSHEMLALLVGVLDVLKLLAPIIELEGPDGKSVEGAVHQIPCHFDLIGKNISVESDDSTAELIRDFALTFRRKVQVLNLFVTGKDDSELFETGCRSGSGIRVVQKSLFVRKVPSVVAESYR